MTSKLVATAFIFTLLLAVSVVAQEKGNRPPVPVDNFKIEIRNFLDEWNAVIARGDAAAIDPPISPTPVFNGLKWRPYLSLLSRDREKAW